jgi:hypothetical protein
MTRLQDSIGQDDNWLDWLKGGAGLLRGTGAQPAADRLASDNDATVVGFLPQPVNGFPGYQVAIKTNYTVGKSILPITETAHATATATAVVQPRCTFATDADPKKPLTLYCDAGQTVDINPLDSKSGGLPDASVLFSVHLVK